MTVALATTVVILAVGLVLSVVLHARERVAWTVERRELVNRAIARHTGEVIALDRQPKVKPGPLDNPVERPVAVGL